MGFRAALVAVGVQGWRRRGGDLVELAVPAVAAAGIDGSDYGLLQFVRFDLGVVYLQQSHLTAASEFRKVGAGLRIVGIERDGEPDVGGKTILRNTAALFQRACVEVLGLWEALVGGDFVERRSLGVVAIGHDAAEKVCGEGIIVRG